MQIELHGHNTRLLAALNGEVLELQRALRPRCRAVPSSSGRDGGAPNVACRAPSVASGVASGEQCERVSTLLAELMERTCVTLTAARKSAVEAAAAATHAADSKASVQLEERRAKLSALDATIAGSDALLCCLIGMLRLDAAEGAQSAGRYLGGKGGGGAATPAGRKRARPQRATLLGVWAGA